MSLPTFDTDPGNGLAHLAAAVSPAMQATAGTPHSIWPPHLALPGVCHYSAADRLPQKLVTKIQALECVEMSEMLPEAWVPDQQEATITPGRPSQNTPVMDILVWTQCFSVMAGVLVECFPDKAPQLLTYLRRIVHAVRNFHGTAWVAYDRLYHHQALVQRRLDWAKEDSSLYNEAFMGQAKAISSCRHCLSNNHVTEACPELMPVFPSWIGPYPLGAPLLPYPTLQTPNLSQEVCRKFNDNRCFIQKCKYAHVCLNCSRPHPAVLCGNFAGSSRGWPSWWE